MEKKITLSGVVGLAVNDIAVQKRLQNNFVQVCKFETHFNFVWNCNSNEMRLNTSNEL